jgi:hypothetical protein
MRESAWEIIWDAAGASPATLLTYGDLMDAEIRLDGQQLVASGKPDFAPGAIPASRGNARRRLEFSRRVAHATAAASWQAALDALRAAPWGTKATLTIQPSGGALRSYTAALLSCRHRPDHADGLIESVHDYAFRVTPV